MPHILKIKFDDAVYDVRSAELSIPARIVTQEMDLAVSLNIPCTHEFHKGILEGLREELRKDG